MRAHPFRSERDVWERGSNDEVIKPRALNTFLDGLAELGVDKRLIKNKKILSDLLEKEKVYRENEREGDDDSDRSDIRDFKQRQPGRRRERHRIRENPKSPLRMTGGEQVDVLRLDPTRV